MNFDEIIKNDTSLLDKYPILEIEYYKDGTKKPFYVLASEKDIREMQIKSDENELDYKFKQDSINKEAYELEKRKLKIKLEDQNTIYDNLIYESIVKEDYDVLKDNIKNANLSEIELKRLSTSLSSIATKKLNDFEENNKEFKMQDFTEWNNRYDIIVKNYSKVRELEGFILSMIG